MTSPLRVPGTTPSFVSRNIPLVRFVTHAVVSLVCILLLWAILWHNTTEQWDTLDRQSRLMIAIELTYWFFFFGLFLDEAKQFLSSNGSYLRQFWNKVQALLIFCNGTRAIYAPSPHSVTLHTMAASLTRM